MATYTEFDVVQELDRIDMLCEKLADMYANNYGIKDIELIVKEIEERKKLAKDMAESFCQSHKPEAGEPTKRFFKSTSGRIVIKVDLVKDVDERRFIEDLLDTHKDEFIARSPTLCKVIMKAWNSNPVPGVILDDYKLPGYFRSTLTGAPTMYGIIDQCINWALDSVGMQVIEDGDKLDSYMATLDSIKREVRALEHLKETA